MAELENQADGPPGRRRKVRIGNLTTLGQVAVELGRLYRQARRGEIQSADASRLASILAVMRQCLESSEIEKRMAELEASLTASATVLPFKRAG